MPGTDPHSARSAPGDVGPRNTLTANRLVLLAAVPLFLVLAVVAFITVRFTASERDAQAWVRHTYQVMEAERLVLRCFRRVGGKNPAKNSVSIFST